MIHAKVVNITQLEATVKQLEAERKHHLSVVQNHLDKQDEDAARKGRNQREVEPRTHAV